jgi:hypothetical protein
VPRRLRLHLVDESGWSILASLSWQKLVSEVLPLGMLCNPVSTRLTETRQKKKSMGRRRCVYVIGAGFSAGLGYPLTSDLLLRLWSRLEESFRHQLQRVIEFHHPGFDPTRFVSFPNVEELLSEMLVNEELFDASRQYEGNFTQTELRDLQRDLLLRIADWFHELSADVSPSTPKANWLKRFRNRIERENAAIISFNWDLILDELLFGTELSALSYGFSAPTSSGAVLLKPHGSLNWFEEKEGQHIKGEKRIKVFDAKGSDSVYAFREFRAPRSAVGRTYAPLIVPPVYLKNFNKPVFEAVWKKCTSVLGTATEVVFLGYSMPSADLHAQFILRCGFNNQVEGELEEHGRAPATGAAPVTIVNPDRSAAQRIAAVVGRQSACEWVSMPAADWLGGKITGLR